MALRFTLLVGLGLCVAGAFGFTNVYPRLKSYPVPVGEDVGDPLFLTPLIESGKIEEARKLALVQHKEMTNVGSYAGYLTVNKQYNSNLFFWFFPAQMNPDHAPVILWLQGGPGDTSLFGLFLENGPFSVNRNQTLEPRKYSWSINHNVIYIDNPVGTGYSFTGSNMGYAINETDVADNLYSALQQFFQLFSELRKNEFYVTGESYAGKYVPSVALAIHNNNAEAPGSRINLQGLAIGNGWSDPVNQISYSDYLYQLGLVDVNDKRELQAMENETISLIKEGEYVAANLALARASLKFQELTGYKTYFNYLQAESSNGHDLFGDWVQRPAARRAIHVGNSTFHGDMAKVAGYLVDDITRSVAPLVAQLLRHYRVLIYNGQLDIVCGYPMTLNYLRNLDWPGAGEYARADRKQWWVAKQLAGYAKTAGQLTEVLVRNAGHAVPIDQPAWAFDLITRFTRHKPF